VQRLDRFAGNSVGLIGRLGRAMERDAGQPASDVLHDLLMVSLT